ncbi:bleomycin resistance family protein [Desulfovibrio sulfodismutans]|uniref:Bleomycin resistance family protein n=1 Tax=Desulfolutivibrio sulfodismutans TaxID=63561 RepID=A0A7K3NS05_9BACT|nr:VOC family protein [Desulfolutivibrio sulfodismutans]NDY58978.1 bleomycin resistance family protein [Desulfolutivibrio sulfodismutans]QLA13275.1 bleomycin resistance family protein [Desulfolutivibrio sulfodismutans DSM 3696]
MPLTSLAPNLMVNDVNRTVDYYRRVLGFDFAMGVTDEGRQAVFAWPATETLCYAMVVSGPVQIMFQSKKSLAAELPSLENAKPGGAFTLYIECDDLDARYAALDEDTAFLKRPHVTFYGMREFYIKDINGYILAFAQKAA